MPTIQKFEASMIEKHLKDMNIRYLVDSQGDYLVTFSYDDKIGGKLEWWLMLDGQNKDIYNLRLECDKRIPRAEWGKYLLICNDWNQRTRWPKAYLNVRDMDSDQTGTIVVEFQMSFEPGIHQELLDDLTVTFFITANSFWEDFVPERSGTA